MYLDEKDLKILDLLKSNSKLTTNQISKKTLIPITTIHNRIKKLEKKGIIKNYTLNLDHKKLGKTLSAYVLMQVDFSGLKEKGISQENLIKEIKNHSKDIIENISIITGDYDVIAKILINDITQLDDFVTKYLRNLNGIKKTQTMVIFSEIS